MNPFALSGLLTGLSSLAMGFFVLTRGKANKLNWLWFFFTISVAVWGFGAFWIALADTEMTALLAWKLSYAFGVVWIPILFYQFVLTFCELQNKRLLLINYGVGVLFSPVIIFSPFFIGKGRFVFSSFYYFTPGSYLFHAYLAWWMWLTIYSHYIVLKNYRCASTFRRNQLKYFLLAFSLSYSMGSLAYLPVFGIDIYPYGTFGIIFYPIIMTYAIGAHRLMDIQTVIHKTAMWGVMSSLIILPVSGIFYFGHNWISGLGSLQLSLLVAAIVLVLIPYIKVVQPRIDHLFQRRKHDMQAVLNSLIRDVLSLKDIVSLSSLITETLHQNLYISKSPIFLWSEREKCFKTVDGEVVPKQKNFSTDNRLLKFLVAEDRPIFRDEIDQTPRYEPIHCLLSPDMWPDTKAVIPFTQRGRVIGILMLGGKDSLKPFDDAEREFLSTLRAEVAIALSNALLFDDVNKMSHELKQWATTLEHKVEERTEELTASNQALEESYVKLQEYDQEKSRFFANFSHELRTPTTFILGPVEMFINRELGLVTFDQEKYLRVIHRNAIRLLNIINKLMDLMKSEAGFVELVCQRNNFVNFVGDIVQSVILVAEKKSLTLSFSGDPNIPEFFFDSDKMEEVLYNLLGNALKFTKVGGITVSCTEQFGSVLVTVTDTGCGIPTASLEKVFERFYQIHNEASRVGMGTGIGLALVQDWVKLHNGRVWVESEQGVGATFLFTIPIRMQETIERPRLRVSGEERRDKDRRRVMVEALVLGAENPQEMPSRAEEGFERILIVDDMPDMITFISDQLRNDYDCLFARDGAEGINRARAENPDLIISDVMMPVKDGYQLVRELKGSPETASIPIILLTAKGLLSDKIEGLEEGADDYLTKPFNKEELKARVRTLLRTRKLQKELQISNRQLEDAILEVRRIGNEFAQSEKMAALGLLIAGVAHELNNPISFAKGSLLVIHRHFDRIEEGKAIDPKELSEIRQDIIESLDVVKGGLARAETIIKTLSSFVRKDEASFTSVDIHAGLDVTLELLKYDWISGIEVHRNYYRAPIFIEGIPGQLNQVFMNIFQNALHAMGNYGTITIVTHLIEDEVSISIRDTGQGIPEENLSKLFEPFFTTKVVGKGTGLGLSLAYKMIVETHHGKINVKSQIGQGSEFIITLPITQPQPTKGDVYVGVDSL